MQEILINVAPYETRAAIVEHSVVQEFLFERPAEKGLVSNIYLGRVLRVLPGMQSAFIDIGLEKAGFLHVGDMRESRAAPQAAERTHPDRVPIERLLFEGQPLLVQVTKDPLGSKGARLSTQISLAGRNLVYLPHDPHLGISQRIGDEAEREALRLRLKQLLGDEPEGGFIVRTMAEEASDAEFIQDIAYLRRLWRSIEAQVHQAPAPSRVFEDLSLSERLLRDVTADHTQAVWVDSHAEVARLQAWSQTYMPAFTEKIRHFSGERPLFDRYQIEEELKRALGRRVDLKSGGYLIIDQTEALTTIDVNTGGYVGGRNFDDTIFKTNLEATEAIARQLRLRNLGGIIILDFIDMHHADHRESVLAELRKALAHDRRRLTVNGFTQLGLVEMTRKRTHESLNHRLCEPCPTCAGRSSVKTARTVCYEILREVLREARQFNPKEFRILASQSVVDLFLEEEAHYLAMLGDFIDKPVTLQVENHYPQEQYDIVLM